MTRAARIITIGLALTTALAAVHAQMGTPQSSSAALYADDNKSGDWPGYGRGFGEWHYTPLAQLNEANVGKLGLAWSMDLGPENSTTQPIAVNGVLYFATGYSVIHAVEAATGKLLWKYDPKAAEAAGPNLRLGWGSRGIAWWNGKIYTGTQDGRLIAVDARTGQVVWSVQTFGKDEPRYISGAPRVFDGKVIVGHGGDFGKVRGYVTTYDAETGKQLWRFYTVPGNPADGFENKAMEMAAKTWHGEWWKFGGGGTVWNSMAYDPETGTVFLGTGNGYPWNIRVRSEGKGDNLFLASIVAVDARTGAYKWHYQTNPGETWDYNTTMDVQLADLSIAGKPRKVLMVAPKNGFFYVIDRNSGKLISAEPFAKVNWASRIDLKTGRPVENPAARYPNGTTATIWPSATGAHGWLPMAYSPNTKLVYIPVIEQGMQMSDAGIDVKKWEIPKDRVGVDGGINLNMQIKDPMQGTGYLAAWDPVTQKAVWKVPHATHVNGGVMATGGDLVFQGTVEGRFEAYSAKSGKTLWSFAAQAPIAAPPVSYTVNGKQYVTVLTGLSTTSGIMGPTIKKYLVDPRSQARRVLTFAVGGTAKIPPRAVADPPIADDPGFKPDDAMASAGATAYGRHCLVCHGFAAISGTHAPDLRRSQIPTDAEAFATVLRDGALVSGGMPRFDDMSDIDRESIRQYIRTEAQKARTKQN